MNLNINFKFSIFDIGSICWLTGSALTSSAEPRQAFVLGFGTLHASGVVGTLHAGGILFIIAGALWVLASLSGVITAHAEAALLVTNGRTPGLGRISILATWLEFIASIILLVGSCLWEAQSFNNASAGAILWLIGAGIFLMAELLFTTMALITASVTLAMPEMLHRQHGWFDIAAQLMFMIGMVIFAIGAAAFVVLSAPGFIAFASYLWLLATSIWVISFFVRLFNSRYSYAPHLSFPLTTASVSSLATGAGKAALANDQATTYSASSMVSNTAALPASGSGSANTAATAAHHEQVQVAL